MSEFLAALAVLWCALTYWLGGQELPFVNRGYKWLRRFVLPGGLVIFTLALGAPWWKALLACAGLCGALHLGYQNKVWKYAMTGALMGLPSLILGLWWTAALPALFHTVFGIVSLKDNRFRWGAYVGVLVGASIGIAYTTVLS